MQILRWSALVFLFTLAYWPLTLNKRDLLYKIPGGVEECKQNPYCRHNLIFFPIQLVIEHGDTWGYIYPIDYLFSQGIYWDDYRMPGYGVPYAFFRWITGSREAALWLLALFQLSIWAVAIGWMLYELSLRGMPKWALIGINFLLSFSPIAYYTRLFGTESLTAALSLMGVFLLWKRRFLLAGLVLTWIFFMRPVSGIYILPASVWIIYTEKKFLSKSLLYFLSPFVLLEGSWILRNYKLYGDFRPFFGSNTLMYPFVYSRVDYPIISYASLLGEGDVSKRSEMGSIYNVLYCHSFSPPSIAVLKQVVPEWAFCSACPPESLQKAAMLGCELAHSAAYSIDPPESLYYGRAYKDLLYFVTHISPTPEDCWREAEMMRILGKCIRCAVHNGNKIEARLYKIKKMITQTAYKPSYSERIMGSIRAKVKRVYYLAYYVIQMLSIVASLVLLFSTPGNVLASTFNLLPIVTYLSLGLLERRYLDILFPVSSLCMNIFLLQLREYLYGKGK
ncbi:MAG: hypothetical protein RMJ66_08485 [Bacteroidia bacterium]|nr:hypothetical protein [Bacteroidia bacterium]MDW8135085.1 hypothetical protein [Bacteroidia bacterium]